MIESLVLIEGESLKEETLMISLTNAKQLVIGSAHRFGVILHVAANSPDDLGKALVEFAKVAGVTGVLTLAVKT